MPEVSCVMVGHNYRNEVQTVAQLFFGQKKVELVERGWEYSTPGMRCINDLGTEIITWVDEAAAHTVVEVDGLENARCSVSLTQADIIRAGLSARRVLMIAMFRALQEVNPRVTPWGALTGIRPSKMVRGWLAAGLNDEEIIHIMVTVLHCRKDKALLALTVARAENQLTEKIHSVPSGRVPIGIYIGIPFCPSRCAYCSFNMGEKQPTRDVLAQYVDILIRECREKGEELHRLNGKPTSLYIGGGTPTVLPMDLLEKLLDALHTCFDIAPEYTVEAGRPDTLTKENLRLMRSAGVNRIAVNPQTLNDHTLAAIGRNHTAADFFRAFSLAREAGFPCINTDLIANLPGETALDLSHSLAALLPLAPENITVHTFSIKRASRLRQAQIDLHEKIIPTDVNIPAGYAPYYLYRQKNTAGLLENVGYSLQGFECLYNIGMMSEVQTILGIGAGAVSKYVAGEKITRVFNEKNPGVYMERRLKHIP